MGTTPDSRPGLQGGYDRRNFDAGPRTYSDSAFTAKIYDATGLANLPPGARVLDIMSGPGKVGLGLEHINPNHHYFFLDLSQQQLKRIPPNEEGFIRSIRADARVFPFGQESLDVVVARYAIKDLTKGEQPKVLVGIRDILRPGERLVIADMVAPDTEGAKEWLNKHHALKQELSGRDPEREGVCHIPTIQEWVTLLETIGFQANIADWHVSRVTTSDWVNSKQITEDQLPIMDQNILSAPEEVKMAFNIWKEGTLVKINYPIIILTGIKPDKMT